MNKNTQRAISYKVKALRLTQGLTAKKLASFMENKTTYTRILGYESGEAEITFPIMQDLAQALGVLAKELYPRTHIRDEAIYGKEAPQEDDTLHKNTGNRVATTVTKEFATACQKARLDSDMSVRCAARKIKIARVTLLKSEEYNSSLTVACQNKIIKFYKLDAKKYGYNPLSNSVLKT